jgi:hypothetical protein
MAPLALGAQIAQQRAGEIDQQRRRGRIDRVDEQRIMDEGEPGAGEGRGHGHPAHHRRPERAHAAGQDDHDQAEEGDIADLEPVDPVGPEQILAVDDLLEDLRLDLDPGHGAVERRWLEVSEPLRRPTDEHDVARELRGIEAGIEQLPGGDEAFRPAPGIVEIHIAIGIDRHDELADLDVVKAGVLAVTRLPVGIGCFDDVGARPLSHPQGLGDQARLDLPPEIEH